MTISQRLNELGLDLPPVAAPVAAYVPAKTTGATLRTSGQLPLVDGALPATGKVGASVTPDSAYNYARIAALNALAAAADIAGGLDQISGTEHVTVFIASAPDFTDQPAVANGASDLFGDIFGDAGLHTRSAVGVAVLPLDAPVEVEVVFTLA